MDAETGVAAASFVRQDAYLRARRREGRLLPDALVATLPDVPPGHPLHREWRMRQDSCGRLTAYLRARPHLRTVLDAGCGNGWLAARIAAMGAAHVVGIDVNEVELDQARRVFGHRANLEFRRHDLRGGLPVERADVVLLASVIQYVADPVALVRRLLDECGADAEVHVLDTPVYDAAEVPAARARTDRHYASIGVPEMSELYHHHDWGAFRSLPMAVLYSPGTAWRRAERHLLRRTRSPFPWIRFTVETRRR
jgi:SAM-dependent methyltransferase